MDTAHHITKQCIIAQMMLYKIIEKFLKIHVIIQL